MHELYVIIIYNVHTVVGTYGKHQCVVNDLVSRQLKRHWIKILNASEIYSLFALKIIILMTLYFEQSNFYFFFFCFVRFTI